MTRTITAVSTDNTPRTRSKTPTGSLLSPLDLGKLTRAARSKLTKKIVKEPEYTSDSDMDDQQANGGRKIVSFDEDLEHTDSAGYQRCHFWVLAKYDMSYILYDIFQKSYMSYIFRTLNYMTFSKTSMTNYEII